VRLKSDRSKYVNNYTERDERAEVHEQETKEVVDVRGNNTNGE
jgi:hypothetical protein